MKVCRLALLVVASSVLAGCGAVTDPSDVMPEVYVENPEVDAAAVAVFGQERVDEAYDELTAFVLAESFPPDLLDPRQEKFGRDELVDEAMLDRLTPEAAADWQARVDAALDGDEGAANEVRTMRYYGVAEPEWALPEDGPVVVSQHISEPEIGVDASGGTGQELLVVSFHHDTTLAFDDEDGSVPLEVEKEMTYTLTPAPAGQEARWLIYSFDGVFEQSEPA